MIWSRSSRAKPVPPLLFFMTKPHKKRLARPPTLARQLTLARQSRLATQSTLVPHLLICVGQIPDFAQDVGRMPHSGALANWPASAGHFLFGHPRQRFPKNNILLNLPRYLG